MRLASTTAIAGLVLTAITSLLACSSSAHGGPACGQEEAPVVADPTYGFPEVVIVEPTGDTRAPAQCSGTILAPRVVLTAGMCVEHVAAWRIRTPYGGRQLTTASTGETKDLSDTGDAMHRLGLVYTDTDLTLANYPELAAAPYPDGTPVVDLVATRLASETVKVTGIHDATRLGVPLAYVADAPDDTTDLGGPVEVQGAFVVLGIRSKQMGARDLFVRADVARPWVVDRIQAHGGTSSVANVATPRMTVTASDPCGSTMSGTWSSNPAR